MNRKHVRWLAGFLIIGIAVASVLLAFSIRSSSRVLYKNHPVSYWTARLNDPAKHNEAVTALSAMGSEALPDLSDSVRRTQWYVHKPFSSLARILPSQVVIKLHRLLGREEARANRLGAIHAVEMLGTNGVSAIPAFQSALTDPDVAISTAAAIALARIGRPAVRALIVGVKNRQPMVRANACYALSLIGPPAQEAAPELWRLCEEDPSGAGLQAASALARIGESGVPVLIGGLDRSDSRLHCLAASILADMRSSAAEAIPALARHVHDTDGAFRKQVVRALANIEPTNPSAGNALLDFLNDSEPEIRLMALQGIANMPRLVRSGNARVVQLLADKDPKVRAQAAYALGQLGAYSTNAVPNLTLLLQDPNEDVRQKAGQALRTIEFSLAK